MKGDDIKMLYIFIKLPEVWKYVTYPTVKPNTYLISSHGRVYSKKTKKILKPAIKTQVRDNGQTRSYLQVVLIKSDKVDKKRKYVDVNIHRLVAWEFVPNPNPDEFDFVHHRNNNSLENYYENLEWSNNYLNQMDAVENGYHNNGGGNKLYSDDFIDELCQMIYVYKYKNDYIKCYILDKYIDQDNTRLTALITHLRKGDRHPNIVNKYKEGSTTIEKVS